jgi:hypothetical protein
MTFASLPNELTKHIIIMMRNRDASDRDNLINLLTINRTIYNVITKNIADIMSHYVYFVYYPYKYHNPYPYVKCMFANMVHSINDHPAIILFNKNHSATICIDYIKYTASDIRSRSWYKYGKMHRDDDLPAYTNQFFTKWYQYGNIHRDNDRPAIIRISPKNNCNSVIYIYYWFQHGEKHRDNDRPAMVFSNGVQKWFQHDLLHREGDKPAILYPGGTLVWLQRGKLSRDDSDLPRIVWGKDRNLIINNKLLSRPKKPKYTCD